MDDIILRWMAEHPYISIPSVVAVIGAEIGFIWMSDYRLSKKIRELGREVLYERMNSIPVGHQQSVGRVIDALVQQHPDTVYDRMRDLKKRYHI